MLGTVSVESFSKLEDPRIERTKKHLLLDIIALVLLATISVCPGVFCLKINLMIQNVIITQYNFFLQGYESLHFWFLRTGILC
jgi:hypothetical protein